MDSARAVPPTDAGVPKAQVQLEAKNLNGSVAGLEERFQRLKLLQAELHAKRTELGLDGPGPYARPLNTGASGEGAAADPEASTSAEPAAAASADGQQAAAAAAAADAAEPAAVIAAESTPADDAVAAATATPAEGAAAAAEATPVAPAPAASDAEAGPPPLEPVSPVGSAPSQA